MRSLKSILILVFSAWLGLVFHPACRRRPDVPRNIILCIVDGAGFFHFEAASWFSSGSPDSSVFSRFPVRYAMSTYPARGMIYDPDEAWRSFSFVMAGPTDSAAAATAMATGVKTVNGAIGMDPNHIRLESTFEQADRLGKATGIVSSVLFSHATPACFAAHNFNRNRYEEIAQEMILGSTADVIMGCGHPLFDMQGKPLEKPHFRYVGGESTWNAILEKKAGGDADGDGDPDAWTLIETRAQFQSLREGITPRRILGLPQIHQTLQQQRAGDGDAPPFLEPLVETVPTLEEMALGAINLLDEDPDGFFLMVEGGAVDWAAHSNQTGRMIEELVAFEKTVEAVLNWVESESRWDETLVIVTSDHETGYLTGPGSGQTESGNDRGGIGMWWPLQGQGRGRIPLLQWNIKGHTNSLVPFYARGAGSAKFKAYAAGIDPVRGAYLDNTAIGKVIFSFLDSE
jgi:alkaline phosphatase